MKKVSGKTIIMTRGDTVRIKLSLTDDGGNPYHPRDGDKIRFAAKKQYSDKIPLILITIPNDTLVLTINPNDTKQLDFGTYVYDIQITYANGDVDTIIAKQTLRLEEEVD